MKTTYHGNVNKTIMMYCLTSTRHHH